MSVPTIPNPACLVVSVLTANEEAAEKALKDLIDRFGPREQELGPLSFDYSPYYEKELGPDIQRRLWFFGRLVERSELPAIKLFTNEVENAYSVHGNRTFNLDPGLITLENFILATGKSRPQRIYLGAGIYADLTLIFQQRSYTPLPWTYPDYADSRLIRVLNGVRENYRCRLRRLKERSAR